MKVGHHMTSYLNICQIHRGWQQILALLSMQLLKWDSASICKFYGIFMYCENVLFHNNNWYFTIFDSKKSVHQILRNIVRQSEICRKCPDRKASVPKEAGTHFQCGLCFRSCCNLRPTTCLRNPERQMRFQKASKDKHHLQKGQRE